MMPADLHCMRLHVRVCGRDVFHGVAGVVGDLCMVRLTFGLDAGTGLLRQGVVGNGRVV